MTPTDTPPVIGILAVGGAGPYGDISNEELQKLRTDYVTEISRAGGTPIILPSTQKSDAEIHSALDQCDGLVLTGGVDVNPLLYGSFPEPGTDTPDVPRDTVESRYQRVAHERGMPQFGICRNAQLMNVLGGGTLTQTLNEVDEKVDHQPATDHFGTHWVEFAAGSELSRAYGTNGANVMTYHQQGVLQHQLSDEFEPVAWSGKAVEAFIRKGNWTKAGQGYSYAEPPFAMGVQWHSEARNKYLPPEERRAVPELVLIVNKSAEYRDRHKPAQQSRQLLHHDRPSTHTSFSPIKKSPGGVLLPKQHRPREAASGPPAFPHRGRAGHTHR